MLVRTDNLHKPHFLHKPPGQAAFTPPVQAGTADPALGRWQTALLEESLHPKTPQFGCRYPVLAGVEAQGLATPLRFSLHLGTDVQRLHLYAFPPVTLLPGVLARDCQERLCLILVYISVFHPNQRFGNYGSCP